MNSKIVCGIVFVFVCIFQLSYAIQCYRCDSESSCRSANTFECNQLYANETSRFLDVYFLNVNTTQISNSYACMRQDLNFSSNNVVQYKGCVYAHMSSCKYTLRPSYTSSQTKWSCMQCNGRDGCNPADRKSLSMAAIILPMILVLIYKGFM